MLKCCYVDPRAEFFSVLSAKLGESFALQQVTADDHDRLRSSHVVIVGLRETDLGAPDGSGSVLQAVVRNTPAPVVAFLPTASRELMRAAIAAGAFDYFAEDSSMEELRHVLRRAAQYCELGREVRRLAEAAPTLSSFAALVGTNSTMRAVFTLASKVASTDATVLITGESGTGKELLARAIHQASPRAPKPFVPVTCSSLPESLIEAELFGHERGAFTGAFAARRGRFESAEQGTIFLDEIGDLTPELQVKLLRVLQERTFERLGSNQVRPMQARVICATHRKLTDSIKAGTFRLDLYYRLNTIEISLPALRNRREDIALLAYTFLQTYAEKYGRPARRISPAALHALEEHQYPGNVRELQNIVERAVVICEGPEVRLEDLPTEFVLESVGDQAVGASFEEEVRAFKRRLIQRALVDTGNNKAQAARSLHIARSYLHRLIEELHIDQAEN